MALNIFQQEINQEKLKVLFEQSFPAIFISVFNAFLLMLILWGQVAQNILLMWFVSILLAAALRSILFLSYHYKVPPDVDIQAYEKPYFFSLLFSSLVWGGEGLWLISLTTNEYQLTIYFFLMGMAGGAISVYSSIRPLVLTTVILILLPATLWFLFYGDSLHLYTGIASSVFLLSNIRSSKVLSSTLHNSFLLAYDLKVAKEQAEKLSRTDFLTKLYNRNGFNELVEVQLSHCLRHHFPVSMIVLDVDHFKKINDLKGHSAGDVALQELAAIMQKVVRVSDICGRMGGEEFTVFLPNSDIGNALVVAEKIRKKIARQTISYADEQFSITASLGVFSGNDTLEKMILKADKAMYYAKQSGRNRICHYNELPDC